MREEYAMKREKCHFLLDDLPLRSSPRPNRKLKVLSGYVRILLALVLP
jgi:hypothetical protein